MQTINSKPYNQTCLDHLGTQGFKESKQMLKALAMLDANVLPDEITEHKYDQGVCSIPPHVYKMLDITDGICYLKKPDNPYDPQDKRIERQLGIKDDACVLDSDYHAAASDIHSMIDYDARKKIGGLKRDVHNLGQEIKDLVSQIKKAENDISDAIIKYNNNVETCAYMKNMRGVFQRDRVPQLQDDVSNLEDTYRSMIKGYSFKLQKLKADYAKTTKYDFVLLYDREGNYKKVKVTDNRFKYEYYDMRQVNYQNIHSDFNDRTSYIMIPPSLSVIVFTHIDKEGHYHESYPGFQQYDQCAYMDSVSSIVVLRSNYNNISYVEQVPDLPADPKKL